MKGMKRILPVLALLLALSGCAAAQTVVDKVLPMANEKLSGVLDLTGEGSLLNEDFRPADQAPDLSEQLPAATYPYRAMLGEAQRKVYDQLYQAVESRATEIIPCQALTSDAMNQVMRAFFYDQPQFFWMETRFSYRYNSSDTVLQVELLFNDLANDLPTAQAQFDNMLSQYVTAAMAGQTPLEQERLAHDLLLDNIVYDGNAPYDQTAYSALVGGRTVCSGYARAFQVILQQMGIPCYYVSGVADGEDHAWNLVYLDGVYYNVDVGWDDPDGNAVGNHIYTYFNCSDAQLASDHTREELSVNLPAAINDADTTQQAAWQYPDVPVCDSFATYAQQVQQTITANGSGSYSFPYLLMDADLLAEIRALGEDMSPLQPYVRAAADALGYGGYSMQLSLQTETSGGDATLLTTTITFTGRG